MSKAYNDPLILGGMEEQLKRRQARLEDGEKPLGWKVGFGAPASLELLGLDAPLVGFLMESALLPAGGMASIGGWTKPIAEPEIAVVMGQDLAAGSDRAATRSAVAAISPAIELADVNFPPQDVGAILVGNVYHRHIILGRMDTSRAGCVLEGLIGRVEQNGTQIAETADSQAMTGDVVDIIRHVANMLDLQGEKLRAGEIIITGSIIPPVSIAAGDEIRFRLDPVGAVSVTITA